jgi:hypothetical protein
MLCRSAFCRFWCLHSNAAPEFPTPPKSGSEPCPLLGRNADPTATSTDWSSTAGRWLVGPTRLSAGTRDRPSTGTHGGKFARVPARAADAEETLLVSAVSARVNPRRIAMTTDLGSTTDSDLDAHRTDIRAAGASVGRTVAHEASTDRARTAGVGAAACFLIRDRARYNAPAIRRAPTDEQYTTDRKRTLHNFSKPRAHR